MSKRLKDDLQIAAIFCTVFGFAIYLIMLRINRDLWWLCFVAGAGLLALVAAYLIGYERLVTNRFTKAVAETGAKVLFQTPGNFLTEYGKRVGNIYFCEDRIVLVSLNKRPRITIEIFPDEVDTFTIPRTVQLNLQMKDGSQKTIHTTDAGMLGALLKKKPWKKKQG